MRLSTPIIFGAVLVCGARLCPADGMLYRFEADKVPYDPGAGWEVFNPCMLPCRESVEDGHFVLRWTVQAEPANYSHLIAGIGKPPPETLWVEWRYRSNHPVGPTSFTCDGRFLVQHPELSEYVMMYADAAFSFSGDDFIFGLPVGEFHTYRFETVDALRYRVSVNGKLFIDRIDPEVSPATVIQLFGGGGCDTTRPPEVVNEWDFVRYGTIGFGEQIVATDPPSGVLDATVFNNLDRFTVTYDSPNYAYIDDITVEVLPIGQHLSHEATEVRATEKGARSSHGATEPPNHEAVPSSFDIRHLTFDIPQVIATRRLDNGDPEVLEIVLDRPMPLGETTRFTFDDGAAVNVVEYTLALPDSDDDGVPDEEDNCPNHPNPNQADCDNDGTGDVCTIAECIGDPACADCNRNDVPDGCDIGLGGSSADCNGNDIPDECDIESAASVDCDRNNVPDECQPDTDGDGAIDPCDPCPEEFINDQDGDGVCFPQDQCPTDPNKLSPGLCGCGVADIDSDGDTVPDCLDDCPNDPAKTSPGQCGCGMAETDSDADTVPDCLDQCPGLDDRLDENDNRIPDCAEKPVVPATSGWGLVVLALALLCVSRINRRRFPLGS